MEVCGDEGVHNDGYQLNANKKHVMITELTGHSPNETAIPTAASSSQTNKPNNGSDNKFFVEEPFDFIFEPDHYPKGNSEKKPKLSDRADIGDDEDEDKKIHKYAQVIRELDDGVLEYEYKSFAYDRSFYTNKLNDDLDSIYFAGFNSQHHIRAESLIRGVSLSRWPKVGFGLELGAAQVGDERLVYVNRIHADSPAELSSLRLGDILIEIDELLPSEGFRGESDDEVLKKITDYMASHENLHLMVVHESQYARLKADDDELLKNYYFNCEDIVIVSFHKQHESTRAV